MSRTKIEWADAVWNPVTGCTPVSEGCQNCYARRFARRLRGRCGYPEDEPFRVKLHYDRLDEPLGWRKPRRVFVVSMGDLFHPAVPFVLISHVFEVMARAKRHTFLILTKRPGRMLEWYHGGYGKVVGFAEWPLPNVWVGVSCENQARANERIPTLLQIPAAVRWVSCEPLLGPVDLHDYLWSHHDGTAAGYAVAWAEKGGIHWVVCGGETGPGARPCHPDWVRSLRDQCQAAGTAFFFKSWGDWWPAYPVYGHTDPVERYEDMHPNEDSVIADKLILESSGDMPVGFIGHDSWGHYQPDPALNLWCMCPVGKKRAGRLLDGREWNEIPGVSGGYSPE